MGTRSLTYILDGERKIAAVYRQFDGYPEVHGRDLAAIMSERARLSNGLIKGAFNGVDELAACVVADLKQANPEGNVYLMHPDTHNVGEEFVYDDSGNPNGDISVRVRHFGTFFFGLGGQSEGEEKVIFSGSPEEFDRWTAQQLDEAERRLAGVQDS